MKRLLLTFSLCLALSSCGWQGGYRYPCQDPANWKAPDCNPPLCNASDTCTTDLLPKEMTDAPVTTATP
jgi:hypothetical protein